MRPLGIATTSKDQEDQLFIGVKDLRTIGCPVPHWLLREQALEFSKEEDIEDFRASGMWLQGFMDRKWLPSRSRTRAEQEAPEMADLRTQE